MDPIPLYANEFEKFLEDFRRHHTTLLQFLQQTEEKALESGNEKLLEFTRAERQRVEDSLNILSEKINNFYPYLQRAIRKRTVRLEKQVEALNKLKDNLESNNMLLEYKKKDLLLLTTKLEEAYEEISVKNKELIAQQQKIYEQSEKLNAVHQEILEKNRALEQQKEALLDQSDYLYEANQTISDMNQQATRQNDEILKKNEELLNLNNEKNNLISIVAHDLKSPLQQIKGLLSLIKLSPSNGDSNVPQYLDMMEASTKRLTDMIAKILDVEAIESKKLNLTTERVNLSEILRILSERYLVVANQKNIEIHQNIGTNVHVLADKIYTEQVFENLISNAIKFSPRDKKIFISLTEDQNKVKGEIRDEGPGISEEDKKKLFSKYQKLSAKPTGNETSTGLGLSIVKKFVEAMNGQIWCESEAGKGASFFVTLPLEP